ncbi:polymer-forming cytoskeletal protein [Sphingomonas gilva]|uniref:Polymer-forming cytoskeletal protein n=1 Tax=Sphingomonas gilva TaxID=2305907 RepID=A0A396RXY5_9SPHN|nr:polymer-forming cytoskeletal protein [Sphingomonas gilva]RHW19333.1 polymer-forming cytoskeletal protein [Sphingomonas gilva]
MSSGDIRDKSGREAVAGIGKGIVVIGDIECASEIQIGGRVMGDVRCQTLFVEPGGTIVGSVNAGQVRVSGLVEGTIEAGDLAVESTGSVSGTITYTRLKVSAGGVLDGSFKHRPEEEVSVETGPLKLVESSEPANPRRVYVD